MFKVNAHRPQECVLKPGNMHLALYTWHSSSLYNHPPPSSLPPAPLLPSHSMWDKSITRWREEAHSWGREREREGERESGGTSGGCESLPRHSGLTATAGHHDYDNSQRYWRCHGDCCYQVETLYPSNVNVEEQLCFFPPRPRLTHIRSKSQSVHKKKNVCKECNGQSSKTAPRWEGRANTGHRIDRPTWAYISLTNHD